LALVAIAHFAEPHAMAMKALKWFRKKADLTLEVLSGQTGISVSQLSRYESGERDPTLSHLRLLSQALDLPIAALTEDQLMIPVVGFVGAGTEVDLVDDSGQGAGIDEIEAPPGVPANAIAVRVRGSSMLPVFHEGDHIIYSRQMFGGDIAEHIGRECVVRLADGRTFIKTIAKGSRPGTWSLWSYNAPPMQDVVLEWAARVRWIERAR